MKKLGQEERAARMAAREERSKARSAAVLRLVDLDGKHGPATPGEKRAAKANGKSGFFRITRMPEWVCPETLKALAGIPDACTIAAALLTPHGSIYLTPLSAYGAKAPLPGGEVV